MLFCFILDILLQQKVELSYLVDISFGLTTKQKVIAVTIRIAKFEVLKVVLLKLVSVVSFGLETM